MSIDRARIWSDRFLPARVVVPALVVALGGGAWASDHVPRNIPSQVTPAITWPAPAGIGYGTALSGAQLDASAATDQAVVLFAGGNTGATSTSRLQGDGTWAATTLGGDGIDDAFWSVDHWVAITTAGVTATSPDGHNWSTGATLTGGVASILDGEGLNVVAEMWTTVVRISRDGGATWDADQYTPFAGSSAVFLIKPTIINGIVYVPSQVGTSIWIAHAPLSALPASGTPWPAAQLGTAVGTPGNIYHRMDAAFPDALFIGGGQSATVPQIFTSTDAGLSWSALTTDLPADASYVYTLMRSSVLSTYLAGRTSAPWVMKSGDLNSWTAMDTGLTGVVDTIAEYNGTVYATQRGNGVFAWNGSAWASVSPAVEAERLAVAPAVDGALPVQGTFAYSPASGAVIGAGTQMLSVTFTPTDAVHYAAVSATTAITVAQAAPVITWAAPAAVAYGTALAAAQLSATASVPGTFAYDPAAGTVPHVGAVLSTTFTPTDAVDYTSASATVALTVTQAVPVVTWPVPAALANGTALSASQLDATADVLGSFSYSPGAGTVLAAGTHAVSATFHPADAVDYASVTTSIIITVLPASPVVSSPGVASVVAGAAFTYQISASNNPTFFNATGLPDGVAIDTATGVVSGTFATAGTYVITVEAGNSGGTGTNTVTLTVTAPSGGTTAPPATATAGATGSGGGGGGCGLGGGLAGLFVAWMAVRWRRGRRMSRD